MDNISFMIYIKGVDWFLWAGPAIFRYDKSMGVN
jgi:hypothetical protein